MKPDATLKPDLTLEHVLAAAVARRVTDGTAAAGYFEACRTVATAAPGPVASRAGGLR